MPPGVRAITTRDATGSLGAPNKYAIRESSRDSRLPSKKSKPAKKAAKPKSSRAGASLECAECFGKFAPPISMASIASEMGKKFKCPNCGALYEIISLQESRITVTILAKGETRTYGKTYDLATKDYARPL